MKSGYSTYKTANVETADQGKLILIAYDVAILSLKQALEIFDDKTKIEQRMKYMYKAQDALSELMCALKLDAGEIAMNLYKLYDYMLHRILESVIKSDASYVKEIIGYLTDLRSAWEIAAKNVRLDKSIQDIVPENGTVTISV